MGTEDRAPLDRDQIVHLLSPFFGPHFCQYAITKPITVGDFAVATDGHAMVRLRTALPFALEPHETAPPLEPIGIEARCVGELLPPPEPCAPDPWEECKECGGTGGPDCPHCGRQTCEFCKGEGGHNGAFAVPVGISSVLSRSYRRVLTLPGVRFYTPTEAAGPGKPVAFTWDHGDGVVVSFREEPK